MICSKCGCDTTDAKKYKKIRLCDNCYDSLPHSFRNSLDSFTEKKLKKALNVVKPIFSSPWATLAKIGICDTSIQVNKFEISLRDIKKVNLTFHPLYQASRKNYVYGMIGIKIEVKEPHMIIEELILKTELEYFISGKEIYYSYPSQFQMMFTEINEAITCETYDTLDYKSKVISQTEEERKRTEETRRKVAEEDKKRDEYQKEKRNTNNKRRKSVQATMVTFEEAKKLYQLNIPFNKKELNQKRKELLKIHHPDAGGSTQMAAVINASYDVLLKYAE